ncbi:oligosaccharide flippase family protein [Polaribacter haliotis]|uniref:Oligosaccharide flippase family protein n=1 Tax=Polaribacter haliotis TaxID=1888915 RepID=A0A7L8AJV2_9FLAO|nr:oligosaccharide flippase family protein [Polaribacter haliotis]QOD62079.1 oligosaccharide flippase family protein [Polaribacter haliotis]
MNFKLNIKFFRKNIGELWYLLSSIIVPAVGFFTSFMVAKFVAPEDNGLIESYFLIIPYVSFIHLGIFNGLNRNIAFYKAKGELSKVSLQVGTSLFVSRLVSVISFVVVLIYILVINQKTVYSSLDYVAISGVLFISTATPIALHIDTTFRSGQDFKKLGTLRFWEAGFQLLLMPLLILLHGYGRVIIEIGKSLVNVVLRIRNNPYNVASRFDLNSYKELFKVGFPLLFGGYLFTLYSISDQSIIALKLGNVALGYYFLSKLIITSMLLVPTSLTAIFYPKASAIFGFSDKKSSLRVFFWKALFINATVLSIIGLFLYLSIDFIVENYIPKYTLGIEAAKINIITGLSFVSIGPSVILGVVKKNTFYIFLVSISLLSMWCLSLFVEIYSIEQVAYFRCVISLLLALGTIIYSYYLTFDRNKL